MPTIDDNLTNWSSRWDWSERGDEWSRWWGGTDAMWHALLLPRLHAMLPARRILEIAPGYGRWTQFLKDRAEHLDVVDLTPACIEACQERFATSTNISYYVNDGRSLEMIEDASVDLAFSFDSLVHAGADVLDAYLAQLALKLAPDGVGFLHHSNAGSLTAATWLAKHVPERWFTPLMRRGVVLDLPAWRDETMSAARFREGCEAAGLACIGQELIAWENGPYLLDALSMFTRPGSRWERENRVVRNPLFYAEARRMRRLYAAGSFG